MTTFNELLTLRRSVRDFKDDPVPLDLIKVLIEESILAPNAGNEQPWLFSVVRDKAFMKRISDESKKNILARIASDPQNSIARYESVLRNDAFIVFYNAPCAAASRGLGSCWINLGADIQEPEMRQALGLSPDTQVVAPVILGYPKKIPAIPKRKPPKIISVIE